MPQSAGEPANLADLVTVKGGAATQVTILPAETRIPWAGHSAVHAMEAIYDQIRASRMVLVFVNTRSQARAHLSGTLARQRDGLPIALHHGSLDVGQRRRVEAAMAGLGAALRRLHLDARSRHRLGRCRPRHQCRRTEGGEPARPAHRPCQSPHGRALACAPCAGQSLRGHGMHGRAGGEPRRRAGYARRASGPARSDVLAQHVLGMACSAPFGRRTRSMPRSRPRLPIAILIPRPSRAWSISWRPAAMRCGPMSGLPRSGAARTASGASRIPPWRSNTA